MEILPFWSRGTFTWPIKCSFLCLQLGPKNLFQQCFEWLNGILFYIFNWITANLQYYIQLIDYTPCSYYNITDHISHTIYYIPVTYSFYSYKINGSFSSLIFFSFFGPTQNSHCPGTATFFFLNQWVCFYLVIFICALSLIPQMMKTYTMVSVWLI